MSGMVLILYCSCTNDIGVFGRIVEAAKKVIIMAVIIMLIIVVAFITVGLVMATYDMVFTTPYSYEKADFLNIFSWLLLIVIGLELLDAIYVLLKKHEFHVETVLLVAVTAVARELIVYNYEEANGLTLTGIALVMVGIATAYYFITRTQRMKGVKHEAEIAEHKD